MRRRTIRLTSLAAALTVALPTAALGGGDTLGPNPDGGRAKTTKGGSCQLNSIAERAGGDIVFGGRVHNCSSRFGFRKVIARAELSEDINTARTVAATGRTRGEVPFEMSAGYSGEADLVYEARFDVTVILKSAKSRTRPLHPEKWKNPSRGCRVMTTHRASDTLGCTFGNEMPPG